MDQLERTVAPGRVAPAGGTGSMRGRVAAAVLLVSALGSTAVIAEVVPGRVVIKFGDGLTECAHCLIESGASFSAALVDGSDGIDAVPPSGLVNVLARTPC